MMKNSSSNSEWIDKHGTMSLPGVRLVGQHIGGWKKNLRDCCGFDRVLLDFETGRPAAHQEPRVLLFLSAASTGLRAALCSSLGILECDDVAHEL